MEEGRQASRTNGGQVGSKEGREERGETSRKEAKELDRREI